VQFSRLVVGIQCKKAAAFYIGISLGSLTTKGHSGLWKLCPLPVNKCVGAYFTSKVMAKWALSLTDIPNGKKNTKKMVQGFLL